MNCDDIQRQLSAYVDGELTKSERDGVEQHIHTCSDCMRVLAELQKVNELVTGMLNSIEVPDYLEAELVARAQSAHKIAHQRLQLQRLSFLYVLVGLAGMLFIGGIVLSPIGMLIRAGLRLSTAMLGGVFALSGVMGAMWLTVIIGFFVLLAALSLLVILRLLRAARGEVVL